MLTSIRQALGFLLLMTLLTGVAYPLVITGISGVVFPDQAHGSLVKRDGKLIGSSLIGQNFSGATYFHPRPSAAGKDGYDANSSSGSNLGVATKSLNDAIATRVGAAKQGEMPVPADLVMASASGLDPHLSPAAAAYQVAAVAAARGIAAEKIQALVAKYTEGRQLGFLGEPRVNVLELNLALDKMAGKNATP